MNSINPELVERYQLLYQEDPKSKVFAPLAEAYRKMGMIEEALRVAKEGVSHHPHFPSGRVALAKVLLDKKQLDMAVEHLQHAVDISPENVLAQSLLAKTMMDLRRPKDALKAYKMLLFLNPDHKIAQNAVKRLESLSAEDFDSDIFSFKNLKDNLDNVDFIERATPDSEPKGTYQSQRYLERMISLADAFIVRNDVEKAIQTLEKAQEHLKKQPEIERRLQMLQDRKQEIEDSPSPSSNRKKIAFLERLLLRIDERKA
ncbi:MAG: tetratricopeptide repeat protein [Bdellovibrionales bacterium]|nr:tetratricopeptide repeat protein [Bdellovibrionales bacterium]